MGKNKRELKAKNLPIIGSIISAMVASICCIGPVVLAVLGVSAAGLFSKFVSFRPYLIGLTIILLILAFYLTYRKREIICEDGTCKIESAGRWNKIALWGGTILVVFLLASPYLNLSNRSQASNSRGSEISEVIIKVEGMTCAGCEFNVENAVKKLDGIMGVKASYQKGEVYIKFEKGKVSIDNIVEAINKVGYKATRP